jgi:hypothetical protein
MNNKRPTYLALHIADKQFRTPLNSSLIESVFYNPKKSQLDVELVSGSIYKYYDVPQFIFDELLQSESAGAYFNRVVKAYPSIKCQ